MLLDFPDFLHHLLIYPKQGMEFPINDVARPLTYFPTLMCLPTLFSEAVAARGGRAG